MLVTHTERHMPRIRKSHRTRTTKPPARKAARKTRLTLSLEENTVQFLHRRRAQVNAPSLSACVEDLVATSRRQAETEELSARTAAYYDAISDEERAENKAWGQLAEREFTGKEI
jgi:hypothetical protein